MFGDQPALEMIGTSLRPSVFIALMSLSVVAACQIIPGEATTLYRHGTIRYRVQMPGKQPTDYVSTLEFSDDGSLRETYEHPQSFGQGVQQFVFAKGQDWRYTKTVKSSGTEVSFDDNNGWPRPEVQQTDLIEKPCLPLGLTLLHAPYPGVTITLTRSKDGSVQKVSWTHNNKEVFNWTYQGRTSTGVKLTLPRVATQYSNGSLIKSYTILLADLKRNPDLSSLSTSGSSHR